MDGTQQLVAVGGLGLVGVNFWTSAQRDAIVGTVWDKRDPAAAHRALLGVGGELLLVFVLTMVAGMSDSLAYGMLAVIAALWILWAMSHYAGGGGAHRPASSSSTPPNVQTA